MGTTTNIRFLTATVVGIAFGITLVAVSTLVL